MKTKTPTTVEVQKVTRALDGKFLRGVSGGPGRPKLGETSLDKLLQAIHRVEDKKNKHLLDYYIERCFKNDQVLISVMKKLLPDLQSISALVIDQQMSDELALDIQKKLQKRFNA